MHLPWETLRNLVKVMLRFSLYISSSFKELALQQHPLIKQSIPGKGHTLYLKVWIFS